VASKKTSESPAPKQARAAAGASRRRRSSEQDEDSDPPQTESHGPQECLPCRGLGTVISNLGGEPSTITCPWCGGGGIRLPAMDAQAQWLPEQDGAGENGDGAPRTAA
jgi:hypothetical protein